MDGNRGEYGELVIGTEIGQRPPRLVKGLITSHTLQLEKSQPQRVR